MLPLEQRLLEDSGHSVQWLAGGRQVQCLRCKEQVKAQRFLPWLKDHKCKGGEETKGWEEPARVPQGMAPQVGHSTLHPSHTLVFFRGIWVCWECRAYACADHGRPRALVQPCKHRRLAGNRDARKMLLKGIHPKTKERLREQDPTSDLRPGRRVAVAGLKTASGQKYNGTQGRLQCFDEAIGRRSVLLDGA